MHNQLRNHAQQEVTEESNGEVEVGPVVTHLQNLKAVSLEVDIAVKELLLERLQGNLVLSIVGVAVLLLVELEVVLNGLAGELGLVVLAGGNLGGDDPEASEDGNVQDEGKEEPCLEASAEAPGNVPRHKSQERDEKGVGKVLRTGAFCGQRGIGNGRIL